MTPYFDNGVAQLYQGDARALPLPDESVHCVVTSYHSGVLLPYYGIITPCQTHMGDSRKVSTGALLNCSGKGSGSLMLTRFRGSQQQT
jgi:hypothetical protein